MASFAADSSLPAVVAAGTAGAARADALSDSIFASYSRLVFCISVSCDSSALILASSALTFAVFSGVFLDVSSNL